MSDLPVTVPDNLEEYEYVMVENNAGQEGKDKSFNQVVNKVSAFITARKGTTTGIEMTQINL